MLKIAAKPALLTATALMISGCTYPFFEDPEPAPAPAPAATPAPVSQSTVAPVVVQPAPPVAPPPSHFQGDEDEDSGWN